MNTEARERFIESWGAMGVAWGINRSMARIHALLMTGAEPLSLDEIAETLGVSRGNASMSLRELRSWGVVRRVPRARDRRDFYETEGDVWTMFFSILRERKRREFDPAVAAVREAVAAAGDGTPEAVRGRLRQMAELLDTGERLLARLLADGGASRAVLAFLAAAFPGKE